MDPLRVEITAAKAQPLSDKWERLTGMSRETDAVRSWQVHWSERSNSVLTVSAPMDADIRLQEVQYPGNH